MIPPAALPVAAVIISALAGAASTVVYHRIAPRPRPGDLHRYFTRGRHRRHGETTAQPAEDAATEEFLAQLRVARRDDHRPVGVGWPAAAMATYPEAGFDWLAQVVKEGSTDG